MHGARRGAAARCLAVVGVACVVALCAVPLGCVAGGASSSSHSIDNGDAIDADAIQAAYEDAQTRDTAAAYDAFLRTYDTTGHDSVALARQRIRQIEQDDELWATAVAGDTYLDYLSYIDAYGGSGRHSGRAQVRIGYFMHVRMWEQVSAMDTVEDYQSFVAAHPDSEFAGTARGRIRELEQVGEDARTLLASGQAAQTATPPRLAEAKQAFDAIVTMQPLAPASVRREARDQISTLLDAWDDDNRRVTTRLATELESRALIERMDRDALVAAWRGYLNRYPFCPEAVLIEAYLEELAAWQEGSGELPPARGLGEVPAPTERFSEHVRALLELDTATLAEGLAVRGARFPHLAWHWVPPRRIDSANIRARALVDWLVEYRTDAANVAGRVSDALSTEARARFTRLQRWIDEPRVDDCAALLRAAEYAMSADASLAEDAGFASLVGNLPLYEGVVLYRAALLEEVFLRRPPASHRAGIVRDAAARAEQAQESELRDRLLEGMRAYAEDLDPSDDN